MKKLLLFLAAVAAFVSCAKEQLGKGDAPETDVMSIKVEAVAPTSSDEPDKKTTLVNDAEVHWVNGDQIKVLFFPNCANPYGNTGLEVNTSTATTGPNGVLTAAIDGDISKSAYFSTDSWTWGVDPKYINVGMAFYPASLEASSTRQSGTMSNNTTLISYSLPSVQTAVENSFQNGVTFSYAKIEDKTAFAAGESQVTFRNACALIRIVLPEDAVDVVSVKVESSSVPLAGKFKVSGFESNEGMYNMNIPSLPLTMSSVDGETVKYITLSAPTGETLKAGASYYIVAWPGTHSNGLTFTFTNTSGATCVKTVSQEVVLEASEYDNFKFKSLPFEHIFEVSEDSFNISGEAANLSFTVTSSRDWTVTKDKNWLSFVGSTSGSASGAPVTVSLSARKNTSGSERTVVITITAGGDTKTVTVTQAPFVAELSISITSGYPSVLSAEESFTFVTINANTDWILSSDSNWLTPATTSGSAIDGGTVTLNATKNESLSERTATLYLKASDNSVEKTITVTQEAGKKTSGYTVVGPVLPEDLQIGKYYVIANYGDPTRYWSVASASNSNSSLSLAGGFDATAANNQFGIENVFYVTSITLDTGMADTLYEHRAQVCLYSLLTDKGLYYASYVPEYRFTNTAYPILINMGAKWSGEANNSVDMVDNNNGNYIHTTDSDNSKIVSTGSGFGGTGPRKWLIFEVQ